jgi:DNA-binding MarR family transcriptional regulator
MSTADLRPEVAADLHSAAIHLLRSVRGVDTVSGLSPARLSALSVIIFAGPISIGELARAEQVRSPTITALVNGLAAEGLMKRQLSPADRRSVVVMATDKGRSAFSQAQSRRLGLLTTRLAGLSATELAVLSRAAELMQRISAPTTDSGDPG